MPFASLAVLFSTVFFGDTGAPAVDLRQLDALATFCAGTLVAAESALLLLAMNVPSVSAWSTSRNVTLGASDVVLGGLLIAAVCSGRLAEAGRLCGTAACLLMLTHAYRDVEFLAGGKQPFAESPSLFVFNNLRLALLGLSLGLTLAL